MPRIRALCVAVIVLTAANSLFAGRYVFDNYGAEQSLANEVVTRLFQDRRGFLWVGTENGLFRYDGHRFAAFGVQEGLPHPYITSLHESADGTLWVGTQHGLAWKRGDRFIATRDARLIRIIPVQSIASDSRQRIYIATAKGLAITRLPAPGADLSLDYLPRPAGATDGMAASVFVAPDDSVWFGCGTAVCHLDHGAVHLWNEASGVPSERWQFLLTDPSGNLWARGKNSLIELPAGAKRFIVHPAEQVGPLYLSYPSLAVDGQGRVLVPTNRGLAIWTGARWELTGKRQGLPINEVSAAWAGADGIAWLGTSGAGLVRWRGYGVWESFTDLEGLPGDHVLSLLEDGPGSLWVGAVTGLGRGTLHNGIWQWRSVRLPGASWVKRMAHARDGALWIATDNSYAIRYDPRTGLSQHYGQFKGVQTNILVDSEDRVWVVTTAGLYRGAATPGVFRFEEVPLPDPLKGHQAFIWMAPDRRGDIWFTSFYGLFRWSAGRWLQFTTKHGLRSDRLGSVSLGPRGDLWLTYFEPIGISRILPGQDSLRVDHFDHSSGLTSDRAYSVHWDAAQRPWVLSDQGADVREENAWIHYGRDDGLLWNDCNAGAFWADPGGGVWIGSSRGLSHRHAAPIQARPAPEVVITGIRLGSQTFESAPGGVLGSGDRSLRVQFSTLTFVRGATVHYRYRLTGLDGAWHEVNGAEVSFASLPAGDYRIEVAARIGNGAWSERVAAQSFRFSPRWYESRWFLGGLFLFVLAAARLTWQYRDRRFAESRRTLERKVDERTRDLQTANEQLRQEIARGEAAAREKRHLESQLVQSQKMEAIGRLAGGVAHDFNNLLTVINGYSALLLARLSAASPMRNELAEIKNAGERAAQLTRELLAFSRKQILQPAVVDLNSVLLSLSSMIQRLIGEDIRLTMALAPDLEPVKVDANQILQVCLNLAANARDAMPGGGQLSIETRNLDAGPDGGAPDHDISPGAYVLLSVTDTGLGMDEETLKHIFEPFFTTKERGRGTGLGLSTVYGIVEQSGGCIRVSSALGKGSSFRIYLPAVLEQVAADPPPPLPRVFPRGKQTILVVEDQEEVRRLAVDVLRDQGYRILEAASGEEALAVAARETAPIEMLLSDVVMTGISGSALANRLKTERPETKVLLMSGYNEDDILRRGLDTGGLAFLPKPFSPEQLVQKVRQVLNPEQ